MMLRHFFFEKGKMTISLNNEDKYEGGKIMDLQVKIAEK